MFSFKDRTQPNLTLNSTKIEREACIGEELLLYRRRGKEKWGRQLQSRIKTFFFQWESMNWKVIYGIHNGILAWWWQEHSSWVLKPSLLPQLFSPLNLLLYDVWFVTTHNAFSKSQTLYFRLYSITYYPYNGLGNP